MVVTVPFSGSLWRADGLMNKLSRGACTCRGLGKGYQIASMRPFRCSISINPPKNATRHLFFLFTLFLKEIEAQRSKIAELALSRGTRRAAASSEDRDSLDPLHFRGTVAR